MRNGAAYKGLAALAVVAAVSGVAGAATAQTQLPEVTVTAPTPVSKRKPPTQPASSGQGTQQAAPPELAPAPIAIIVDDVFVPLTVLPEKQILATPGANLADSLQYQPGIAATTFAPGASRPVIRGLEGQRVLMLENGIGTHDVSTLSDDHAVPIDPFAADQIEVVRGPATLRYGSQAIGGVVSTTNGRIPDFVPKNGFTATLKGGLGSVDDSADGGFKVTAGAGNVVVHADRFWRSAGDYSTPEGKVANSFVDNSGFSVGTSYVATNGFMGVSFTRYEALYGIPLEDTHINMLQDKLQSRGEWRVKSGGIEAIRYWFGGTNYQHTEVGPDGVESLFRNKQLEGRVELEHQPLMTPFGALRGAFGTQFGERKMSALKLEGDNLLEPNTTKSAAAFWFEELQMTQKLRLQVAGRIEQSVVSGIGLDVSDPTLPEISATRQFAPKSASFGMLYDLPMGVVARLTGQYVERAPTETELFLKGAHDASGTFEMGSPFLTEEKAKSFEFGLRKAKGTLRFDASAYYTAFNGFIFRRITNDTCDATLASCTSQGGPGGDLKQTFIEQRNAIFYGAELAAQLDVGRVWQGLWGIDGQYDFVHATFDDAIGGYVPRIPPHRVGAGIYYRDPAWFARVGFLHAFDQDQIGADETPTKGYTLLNADLSYTFKGQPVAGAPTEYTIGLKGENLLDDDVRNHVAFRKDELLQPGRTVRLYGTIKLN